MAVIHIDGFDHLGTADLSIKWDAVNGSPTVNSTGGRNGKGCFSGSQAYLSKNFGGSKTDIILSAAFKFTQNGTNAHFMQLLDGNASNRVVLGLMWASDNTIKIDQPDNANNIIASGGPTILTNAWNYIEWKMQISSSISAHSSVVRVNGAVIYDLAAASDTHYISTSFTRAAMGSISGAINAFAVLMDDAIIMDLTGSVNNDFIGDVTIESIYPNASGNYSDFGLVGAASHAAAVNEHPQDGDTSYLSSTVVGNRESFTFGALSDSPLAIKAIQVVTTARKQGTGTRTIAPFYRQSGTNYDNDASAQALGDSYAMLRFVQDVNPATGVAWTPTEIAAMESGTKVVT